MNNIWVHFWEGVQIILLVWAGWLIYKHRKQFLNAVYLFIIRLLNKINRGNDKEE
jgi:multidrug transporter EmrE-like cation transporter